MDITWWLQCEWRRALCSTAFATFMVASTCSAAMAVGAQDAAISKNAIDEAARWDDEFGIAIGCNGHVGAVAAVPDGTVILGGSFTICGNVPANGVVRWNPELGTFIPLGTGLANGVTGDVIAVAVDPSGTIYVGGLITAAGGSPVRSLARFDPGPMPSSGTWSALGTGASNGVSGIVLDVAVAPSGSIFVGGSFNDAGGILANNVARFDPGAILGDGTWSSLGTEGANGVDSSVRTIAVSSSGTVYVGGSFLQAGGTQAYRVARFDPDATLGAGTWSPLGTGIANGVSDHVFAVTLSPSGSVYVAGTYTQAGGASANRVARFDPGAQLGEGTWAPLTTGTDQSVTSIVVAPSGSLFVGGVFSLAGGTAATCVARFDPGPTPGTGTWSALGTGAVNGAIGQVSALAIASNGALYVSGLFAQAGGATANGAARFDPGVAPGAGTWSWLGSGAANGVLGAVNAFALSPSGHLFAGGSFSFVGGTRADGVAEFSPGGSSGVGVWSSLGTGSTNGVAGEVFALAVAASGSVYVGGSFIQASGAENLARFDPGAAPGLGTWSALGSGVNGEINAIAVAQSGSVYVGGTFTEAGGVPANRVARFDPGPTPGTGTWSPLGAGVDGVVNALALDPLDKLYVAGAFLQAGGATASRVARFEPGFPLGTGNWSTLGTGSAEGVNGDVRAIAITPSGSVYVAGGFLQAGGLAANRIARFDPGASPGTGTWSTLGTDASNGVVGLPRALVVAPSGALYVGGSLAAAGGVTVNRVARFVPGGVLGTGTWSPLGSGVGTVGVFGAFVQTLAVGPSGNIYVGGSFDQSGGRFSLNVGRYDDRAQSQTLLSAQANPLIYSSPLTLTAAVTVPAFPGSPGNVGFVRDGVALPGCSAVPVGAGPVSTRSVLCSLSSAQRLPVGTHPIVAQYSGDVQNFIGTSDPLTLDVIPPTITLAPTSAAVFELPSGLVGQGYSQQLTATTNGSPTSFTYAITAGFVPGMSVVPSNGLLVGSPSQAGTYTFTVTAFDSSPGGDGGPFSDTQVYRVVVAKRSTATTIGAIAPSPATAGQSYTVPVTVQSSGATPDGTVSVSDGQGASCLVTLSNGAGQCAMVSSTSGTRTIEATYGEQIAFLGSSDTESLQVLPAAQIGAVVSAADRIGQRDRLVTVPLSIRGEGTTVKFAARVTFDPAQFQSIEVRPVAPATCVQVAANQIEVSTLGSARTQPLPAIDTPFCDVTFRLVTTPVSQIDLTIDPGTTTCQDGGGSSNTCAVRNGRILVSSLVTQPDNGTLVNIAGYQGEASETRVLILSNVGTAPIDVSNCQVLGTGFSLVTPPPSPIGPGNNSRVLVGCTLDPFPGTRQGGLVQCATSDVVRTALSFGLACTTVASGGQLPGDQVFNNSLKQGDEFGRSTAVSDIGGSPTTPTAGAKGAAGTTQLMVVGAPNAGSDSAGRIFIFEGDLTPKALQSHRKDATSQGLATRLSLDAMRLSRVLGPPRAATGKIGIGDKFGTSVAISPNGMRVAVGAPLGGNGDRGQVLLYDRPIGGWGELDVDDVVTTLDAPPPDGFVSAQEFGDELAFTANGDLVIGAPGTDSISSQNIGAVYFYQAEGNGYAASPQRSGSPNAVPNGRFGSALAANEAMIVIGAPQEGAANSQAGAAYLLPLANGMPTTPERFLAAGTGIGDKFGSSVAVGSNGMLVVGAINDDVAGTDSGSATVFRMNPNGAAPIEVTTLMPETGPTQGAGASVATNDDLIVLGAPLAALDGNIRQGRAYLFEVEPQFATAQNLSPRARLEVLKNVDAEVGAEFGQAVAINRSIAVAGVPLDDRMIDSVNATDVGRADPFALERIFRADFE